VDLECFPICIALKALLSVRKALTSNDLWSLEVLIRMEIARGKGKVQTKENQEQVRAPPHNG
jgi:hypothetical protein